uniref:Uncharacterized protein n=1 Tax=Arundo donax TaxID=35708 RepID=A0A0A8Z2R2_ARUDO
MLRGPWPSTFAPVLLNTHITCFRLYFALL